MHKIRFVVRCIKDGDVFAGYTRQLTLPFVPQVGMEFEQGVSCTLWETRDGREFSPRVERVIYDVDEEEIVCLFSIASELASAFWTELKITELDARCFEMKYFRHD